MNKKIFIACDTNNLKQVKKIAGGHTWWVNKGTEIYNKFLTKSALRRMGT